MHKEHPDEPIDIYGHSWGGEAGMQLWNELQEAGISVRSVTLYDPVSMSQTGKPAGASGSLTNYYVPEKERNKKVSCPPVRRAGLSSEQAVFARVKPPRTAIFPSWSDVSLLILFEYFLTS